jgi:hypothetical protein
MKPFDIMHIKTKLTVDEFLSEREAHAKDIFSKEKDQVRPFCTLLLKDGTSIFTFLDFSDGQTKDLSMHQIKLLSFMSGAIAYFGVYEAYLKRMAIDKKEDMEKMKLLNDLDYQISLMPDREEVLIMIIEYKKNNKVVSKMITWRIENNPSGRTLIKRDSVGGRTEGRMTGIIRP